MIKIFPNYTIMTDKNKAWPLIPGGCKVTNQGSGWWPKAEGAKNILEADPGCHLMTTFYLGTYNCRSLSSEGRLQELEEELSYIKWDIIGLCEVRRKGEETIDLKSGHMLYYKGTNIGNTSGVGFIINKKWKNNIVEIDGVSDRVARLVIQLNSRYQMQIIQVYAPTSSHSDEVVEDFYMDVQKAFDQSKQHFKIVMGDFNARIGKQMKDESVVGNFGYGNRNERGHRLVEFAEKEKLYIMNSFFEKNVRRKWTWKHPNEGTAELDYILTNRKYIFQDCNVLNKFNTGSDHRLVRGKIHVNVKLERQKLLRKTIFTVDIPNLQKHSNEFKLELTNRFQVLVDFEHDSDLNEINMKITDTLLKTATKIAGRKKQQLTNKISTETRELMKKRRNMKICKNDALKRIEYLEFCKMVRKRVENDIRKYNCELARKAVEENKSLKNVKQHFGIGRKFISAIRKKDGIITKKRDDIMKLVENFYQELYSNKEQVPPISITSSELPRILNEEVRHAIKCMKKGKAPGNDGIIIDILKEAGEEIETILAKLYTKCLNDKDVPEDWKNAVIILIFKKGDKEDIRNYRPISLLSVLYKIFTKIITTRLQRTLDFHQPREQAGFKSGFSTIDHIQVLREVIERTNEYELSLCFGFVDYEKAFDSIHISSVIKALDHQGIDPGYCHILKNIYKNATATIRLHNDTGKINIEKGVRQGDSISPKLFTAVLQEVFCGLKWETKGVKVNGEYLSHLDFADDVVVFANNASELQEMLQELADESRKVGLKINVKKTKVMFNRFAQNMKIKIDYEELEEVNSYKYLGQIINTDGNIMDEINHRIKLGWSAFGRNNLILKGNMPMCLKRMVFNKCVLPVLTYGSETWTLNRRAIQRLQTTQRSMERCMLGVTRRDRKRNVWVRQQTGVTDLIEKIKRLKWSWAGHIARRDDNRWTIEILNWIPRDCKRPRKRPHVRWMDEIRKCAGVLWRREAKDRRRWIKLGETFILQWIDNG